MPVLRTPEERFSNLPGFPFAPNHLSVRDSSEGHIRMHFVDEGPSTADPILLLHGQPTWSYLYRRVIDGLVGAGHRVVAPDLVGFGRSDKPSERTDHTLSKHVDWMAGFVAEANLMHVTLVVQDWGGPIGLSVLAADPDRFDRVVAANTVLHTGDPALRGRLGWTAYGTEDGQVVLEAALVDYVLLSQRAPSLDASVFVRYATTTQVPEEFLAAYDAPFPDESYKAAMRQFPVLIPLTPNDPGAAIGRRTWEVLEHWDRPFLTAYSDGDPATRGWDQVFQARVPGARGLSHPIIAGAGHFLQEDQGEELASVIAAFIAKTPRSPSR